MFVYIFKIETFCLHSLTAIKVHVFAEITTTLQPESTVPVESIGKNIVVIMIYSKYLLTAHS